MLSSSFTKLVMIGGKSGVGKTETIRALLKNYPDQYRRPISITTRIPRSEEDARSGEYMFVSQSEFERYRGKNELVNCDYVYNNWYGILRESIEECIEAKCIAIKEIHPINHEKIARALGSTISVLLEAATIKEWRFARSERHAEDDAFFEKIDKSIFDLVAKTVENSPNSTARELHLALQTLIRFKDFYPSRKIIDDGNRYGYNLIAPEFEDDLRVTTRNFHDATRLFFEQELQEIREGSTCLEIGPGNGWLRNEFKWPAVQYESAEISINMSCGNDRNRIVSSASCLPFETGHFDAVLCSLADPFLYPSAIIEMQRVVKPGGCVIVSTPAEQWAKSLRQAESIDKTTFLLSDGRSSSVYSFARKMKEISEIFSSAGMTLLKGDVVKIGDLVFGTPLSPALISAANNLQIDIGDLEIIYCMKFTK